MNISLSWLKQYINLDEFDPVTIGEILTSIGLEVEGMEEKESVPGGLKGIVVGEVLTCDKHPNADKLSLTTVNLGSGEPVQIVCGAPNVAAGQKVLVATVGAQLHPSSGEPFKIKKGKIRGEVSEGMICAEDEIGLGTGHDGIMVLPEATETGITAAEHFSLETDIIYEIGLTPNRADANSHLGVARDLLAALRMTKGANTAFNIPSIDGFKAEGEAGVKVVVENEKACPRYAGVVINNIKVGESPKWLKNYLNAIGSRPINNVVDITNYVLHETGQPLHAFDLEKIKDKTIRVKTLAKGSKFTTLDEVERELTDLDLMICDGESTPMCIAGVFGGMTSGVTEGTTSIFLESAYFNPKFVRRSSMHHILRTDAATHFEKGVDPNGTLYALKRAALLLQELAEGMIQGPVIDLYPNVIQASPIKVRFQKINEVIGVDIPKAKVLEIYQALDFEMIESAEDHVIVRIPTDKPDVLREVDVIEEILRIYGFNEIEIGDQIKSTLSLSPKPDPDHLRNIISEVLVGNGFFEMMGMSISQSKYAESVLPFDKEKLVFISNTSNIGLDIMRPTMFFNGMESILHNQNRQHPDLRLFEFGRTYMNDEEPESFIEDQHLTLYMTGQQQGEGWQEKTAGESFYSLKAMVHNTLSRLGISGYQMAELDNEAFDFGMKYFRGPNPIVSFGRLRKVMTRDFGIKNEVFAADFNWDVILKSLKKHKINFVDLNKYPTVRRDLALVIEKSVTFQDIEGIAKKLGKKLLSEINLFDVYENDEHVGAGKKSYAISLLFSDDNKTLKDKDVEKLINQMINTYETKLGAVIRR